MSWLRRSLSGSLRFDAQEGDSTDEDDDDNHLQDALESSTSNHWVQPGGSDLEEQDDRHNEGDASDIHVLGCPTKKDLSKFNYGQFRGLASILDPPTPPPPPSPPFKPKSDSLHTELGDGGMDNDDEEEEGEGDNDEFGEYEKRGSGQLGELEGFLPLEDYYSRLLEEAVGVTEEVLAFARNIAHHPETWLDFPIEEEEFEDFDITDAQYKHVLAVEHLAPRLAALRIEFCPIHMSEGYFWMVYFVLLHSRLNKHDADLLSSPQIVEARGMWRKELEKQTKEESYWLGTSTFNSKEIAFSRHENFMMHSYRDEQVVSDQIAPIESSSQQITAENEIEKHLVNEIEFIDKPVIREDPSPELHDKEIVVGSCFKIPVQVDNDDDDDGWLREDSDLICLPVAVNEEEISFSDLEDDLDSTMPTKWKTASTEENIKTS